MSLLSMLGLAGNGNAAPPSYGFRSYVKVNMGDAAYDTEAEVIALITGTAHADYRKIWEMTVPAQQRLAWGFGSAGLPHNQGYMWFAALDIAADWDDGVLRLQQANARETNVIVVAEIPDNTLHTATVTTLATARPTDRNSMIALPEKVDKPLVREDSRLQLTYRLITAATAHDHVGFDIPITVYQ
jgi:hypothetical protein